MESDTIAAVSTPYAKGGIGIIRISGQNSVAIASKFFTGTIDTSHTIRYGFVYEPETMEKIDEVLITYMKAPNSYTMEDVVEINCHSGIAALNKIMDLTLKYGARLAEAGEFTKRAFLNGRIDLTKAEAVIDVINAKTEAHRKNAVNQLEGGLFNKIKWFMDKILLVIAEIEATIDYPEYTDEVSQGEILDKTIEDILKEAQLLYNTADTGRIIKDGVNTVIVGNTNVGKSSLLNYFAKAERAIVTSIHGTTRDILEESINLDGILLRLIDTAGIRDTNDIVENIGITKARQAASNADLVLVMFDGSNEIDYDSLCIETKAHKLAIINKTDLQLKINTEIIETTFGYENVFFISIKNDVGLDDISKKIKALFVKGEIKEGLVITNMRHKDALCRAISNLNSALISVRDGYPVDISVINLTEAYRALCEITGENVEENIVDKIFSAFCLGK